MAVIRLAPGIESMSGAMSKINLKSQHKFDDNMFLATHRKKATMQVGKCQRAYFRKAWNVAWNSGNAVVTSAVLAQRATFAIKSLAVQARRKNLAVLTLDQQNFAELKDEWLAKQGYPLTYTYYYWKAAAKYLNGASVDFPESASLNLTYNDLL